MQRLVISTFFIFASSVMAAPELQMHVFEENETEAINAMQTHVFTGQNHYSKYPSQTPTPNPSLAYQKASLYLRTGYRQDKLFWNIGANSGFPNVLSELKWENIEVATLNFGVSYAVTPKWLLNFDAVYGRIFDGDNQDSDYESNNRTFEFSRSNNGADEGDVYDISLSTAFRIPVNDFFELQPEIGISYHAQNLKMVDGYQTISEELQILNIEGYSPNPLGPFSGLNTTYDATWFGPWFGWNAQFYPTNRLSINLGIDYHYISYDATANWNLRGDFAHPESFTHKADGYGWVTRLEGQYKYSPSLTFDLALNYQEWLANENGVDKVFLADGTTVTQPFNEVQWRSYGLSIGLNYDF